MSGPIQNREAFLNKISGRLGRDKFPSKVERPKWSYNPQDAVLKEADLDELLEALKTQCTKIHTDLIETNIAGLAETVRNIVSEYGGGPIVTWKDSRFDEYGLSPLFNKVWPGENVEVHEWDASKEEENIKLAEKANIGITISDITLAESGTAVLFSSKDKGRTVSFLPLKSVIIIPKSSLVPRMTQAARIIREKTKNGEHLASCINFITGPSNSADIEMNLVVGVHGPVNAAYIVVEDL
ncbi:LutC/YkgG family protein [Lederbergia citrea]|uniref:Lactate utilization protein C n=1 Tax=Lederbergia citrea TaxID=2833581 RepID=A0A942UN71_9BACI|nr:lactate utilization protein C [Lederbergia citrea]MBS4206025.1 lactate utilization protein C [Lederbergia citrea]MBS4224526.1 lactate utilization protein C [Lederbergia citrea]